MKKCVIPISGGMDSTVILYSIAKSNKFDEIYTLSFDYNQRHIRELEFATYHAKALDTVHKTIDVSFIRDIAPTSSLTNDNIDVAKTKDVLGDPQTVNYVPFRNMIFLSICSSYAESVQADTVFHGAAQVDTQAGYWDGSKEFLNSINDINSLNRRQVVTIEAPLLHLSKKEIIELGIKNNVDFAKTHTCYSGKEKADAQNPACAARIKGFIDAGYIDPVKYKQQIPWKQYECSRIPKLT